MLRINENLIVEIDQKKGNLKDKKEEDSFDGYVVNWKTWHHFTIATKADKIWYLMSNNSKIDAKDYYEKRFKIEKNYQDCKSSGYNIENNKIRKYDRFRRMMYLVVLAHALTTIIGYIINAKKDSIKKNCFIHPNTKLILAFLESDTKPYTSITRNPCISLDDSYYIN